MIPPYFFSPGGPRKRLITGCVPFSLHRLMRRQATTVDARMLLYAHLCTQEEWLDEPADLIRLATDKLLAAPKILEPFIVHTWNPQGLYLVTAVVAVRGK